MKRHHIIGFSSAVLALSVGLSAGGCSSSGDDDDDTGPSGTGGATAATGGAKAAATGGSFSSSTGGSFGTGGGVGSGNGGSTSATSGGTTSGKAAACNGVPFTGSLDPVSGEMCGIDSETEAVAVPVDMYIMMDRSSSMLYSVPNSNPAVTRWSAFEAGMRQFVMEASSQDLRAGIGFFGASTFGGDDAIDCDVTRYSTPEVEIGPIADVADELVAAIVANQPAGFTPTLPALTGAVNHAKDWVASGENMDRTVVVVLVTDGYPTQCQAPVSIPQIADVAKAAYEDSKIRTFVIGLAAGFNLNTIAQAGGTENATLLDENEPTSSLVEALTNITSTKVACEYEIPAPTAGMEIDTDKVQLIFTPTSSAEQEIPRVDSAASCGVNPNGGWYYDNPMNPKRIFVCPCTCSRISQAGRLRLTIGCAPTFGIR